MYKHKLTDLKSSGPACLWWYIYRQEMARPRLLFNANIGVLVGSGTSRIRIVSNNMYVYSDTMGVHNVSGHRLTCNWQRPSS